MASLFLWVGLTMIVAVPVLFALSWAATVGAILMLIGAVILIVQFFAPYVAERRKVVVVKEAE